MLLSVPFDWCRLAFSFISCFFHSAHLLGSPFPRHGSPTISIELYTRICSRLYFRPTLPAVYTRRISYKLNAFHFSTSFTMLFSALFLVSSTPPFFFRQTIISFKIKLSKGTFFFSPPHRAVPISRTGTTIWASISVKIKMHNSRISLLIVFWICYDLMFQQKTFFFSDDDDKSAIISEPS